MIKKMETIYDVIDRIFIDYRIWNAILLSSTIFTENLEDRALNAMAEDQPVCKAWP